jgi:hypothetical protein
MGIPQTKARPPFGSINHSVIAVVCVVSLF